MSSPTGPAVYLPPESIDLPSPGLTKKVVRRVQTVTVFAGNLGPKLVRRRLGADVPAEQIGISLRKAFDQLGSTYVKFGQVIASSPGAFGPETAAAFRTLLDAGEPVPFQDVRASIETAFGKPWQQVFAHLDPVPLAAASMAVVHRAELPDGRQVAVKVLRPGMARRVAIDLDVMQPLFKGLANMGLGLGAVLYRYVSGFRAQVAEELDLRNEARTMLYMRGLAADAGITGIVIPEPIDGLIARNVLVMEYLDGVAIDDLERVQATGVDPKPLIRALLDFWFLTGLRDGVFHGDIHAGNLLLLTDGRLGLIDWGIVGVLDERTRYVFRRFVKAVLGDADAFADVAAFMAEMMPFAADGQAAIGERRPEIGAMLTKPFGEVDMGQVMRRARSGEGPNSDAVGTPAGKRRRRRFQRDAIKSGLADSNFGQANFLLLKQLLYFERYGSMYLAEDSLLGDRDYILDLLEGTDDAA